MVKHLQILFGVLCLVVVTWNFRAILLDGGSDYNSKGVESSSLPTVAHTAMTSSKDHSSPVFYQTGNEEEENVVSLKQKNDDATVSNIRISMDCQNIQHCRPPIIDVLSTGSITRPDYQTAQQEFLSRHLSVRHYFAATEVNDTEVNCHERLNWTQVKSISKKCRRWNNKQRVPLLARMVNGFASIRFLQKKANPVGWMCAQKRPLTALWNVLQDYRNSRNGQSLPDYLFMVDDDTWLQMDTLVSDLLNEYPAHLPNFLAGCQINFKHDNFTIPFGGYGMIWTRAALERWIQPLVGCDPFTRRRHQTTNQNNEFVRHACERYQQHHRLGERIRPGDASGILLGQGNNRSMTVADILYGYVQRANYTDEEQWDGIGYCLHSDWALGYFAAEYQIIGQMKAYRDSHIAKGVRTGECMHATLDKCWPNATICHYMTPQGIRERIDNTTAL
jgi:hypothetical protein